MGPMAAIVGRLDDRGNRGIGRLVFDQAIDEINQRRRLQEDKASGIEVIRQRAKGLRPKPDLGAAFPLG